jgi:hypothetical protein
MYTFYFHRKTARDRFPLILGWVLLVVEELTVSLKCRIAIKALFFLIYGHAVVRGPHEHRGQANLCMFNSIICMLCKACFLMFKHWFCWKYQYNKYMFNSIDIYRFIPVSGCVYIDPVHCFSRVPFMLSRRRWLCCRIAIKALFFYLN